MKIAVLALFLLGPALPAVTDDKPPVPVSASASDAAFEEADGLWAQRAEGSTTGQAPAGPIDKVTQSLSKTLETSPDALGARWRLMRALYFKGEYTTGDIEEKKKIFDQGKRVGEDALVAIRKRAAEATRKPMEKASIEELSAALKGDRDVLSCFFWAAVDWGKWSLAFGKGAAVKQGAAAKIRDYAKAVIAMDPAYEEAGGYRVLGRLHHQTPSVPFITGWASRSEALANVRLAVQTAPKNFVNRHYLAEAMWDYEKPKRAEARAMLEALIADTPSTTHPVEDRKTQEEAKALLAAWKE